MKKTIQIKLTKTIKRKRPRDDPLLMKQKIQISKTKTRNLSINPRTDSHVQNKYNTGLYQRTNKYL